MAGWTVSPPLTQAMRSSSPKNHNVPVHADSGAAAPESGRVGFRKASAANTGRLGRARAMVSRRRFPGFGGPALLLLLVGSGGYLIVSKITVEKPDQAARKGGAAPLETVPLAGEARTILADSTLQSRAAFGDIRSSTFQRRVPDEAAHADPFLWIEPPGDSGAHELTPPFETDAPGAAFAPALPKGWPRFYPTGPGIVNAPLLPAGADGLVTQAEVLSLINGLEAELTAVETALINEIFGESMPLTGNKLSQLANQALPALHQVTGLKDSIKNGLATLNGAPAYTKAQVEQAITNALSAAQITFGAVTIDATNPTDLKLSFNTSKTFPALVLDLDGALGLPGLGMQTSGQASTVFSYTVNIAVGVDAQGFYLNTSTASVLSVGFTTTVPGLTVPASLSKLRFILTDESATDGDAVPPTSFTGTFSVDLLDPGGADNRLRVNEITGSDLLNAVFSGSAAINLNLASDLSEATLPAISADLNVAWTFSNAAVDPLDANAAFGAVPVVAFKNVTLDLGSFLTRFARPVLEKVREVSEPVQPFVEAVKEDIPLLVQLNGVNPDIPRNLLRMAVENGSITQQQADRFDIMAKVIEISNSIPASPGAGLKIDLGDFNLGSADPRLPNFNIGGITPNKIRTAALAALQHPLAQQFLTAVQGFPKDTVPGASGPGRGMQFPILDNPETAFGLLLGKNVDLFTMDNSTQNFSLGTLDKFVPIARPLGFRFQGTGNVRVEFDFGFDTAGLVQFVNSGDVADILNGFYVNVPVNAQNQPLPMAEFKANFKASLAANFVVAEVGAGGGLYADAHASLADPNSNRRVHLDEFIDEFIDEFTIDPLCVLAADGSLDFGLRAYVSVGVWPIEKTFEFEHPVGSIFDFSFSCSDDPLPVLARMQTGSARLHLGPEAPLRQAGNITDGAETFSLSHAAGAAGSEEIAITYNAGGSSSAGIGALRYGPVSSDIRGDGGAENDTITLAADIVSPALLNGNAGLDRLTGGAGGDTLDGGGEYDVLQGRGGADILRGGDGPDALGGGAGGDVLDGGPGSDTVSFAASTQNIRLDLETNVHTNDALGDTFIAIERFEATPYNDTLIGSPNSDSFFGLAGNDRIEGRDGDDGMEGGPGADTLIGGAGYDYTTYFFSPAAVEVNLLNLLSHGGDAEGDTLDGIESLIGSNFADTLTGNADDNYIDGLVGGDTLNGGAGHDELHGGLDQNGGEPDDTINGGPGDDRIFGDGKRDWVDGGEGNDFIDMTFVAPSLPACAPPDENDTVLGGPGNDVIWGSPHNDIIDAGDGDDFVSGWGGRDTPPPCPAPPGYISYPKWITEGGVYRLHGMGGDAMDGGPGNDTVSFEYAAAVSNPDGNRYGVNVNLGTGALSNAAWESSIIGFENVVGTPYQDTLTGSDEANIFWPLRGGGTSAPFTGGPDYIHGLGGVDTLVIDFSLSDYPELGGVSGPAPTQFGRSGTAAVPGDGYIVSGVEQYHLTGASKNDFFSAPVRGYDDIFIGNGGNDFLGGFGGSDVLRGGEGNDSITGNGYINFDRYGVTDGLDVMDGGPGDDVIENVAFDYWTGQPMLAAEARSQLDGGPGFDKLSFNFSNQPVPIIWTSAAPASLEFADGAYARNFEAIDVALTGPGNDSLTQEGRVNNYLSTGPGDDVMNPGIGSDTVVGGPGIDLCIVDWSVGDTPELGGVSASDSYNRYLIAPPYTHIDYVRLYEIERVHFTGTSKADTLYGGSVSSVLFGRGGDDALTGADGNDQIEGHEGNDTIRGNAGSDQLDGGEGNDGIYTKHSTTVAGNATIRAGAGNDLVYAQFDGQPGAGYGSDTIEMGEGDDNMVALWFDGAYGRTYALPGNIQRFDGGPGNDIGSADFGNQSQGFSFIEGTDNVVDFPDGSYYRHFERLRYMTTGSGNDRILLTGRAPQDISLREGNDMVNPGLGIDKVFGGAGEDTLVVDWSLDDDASLNGVYFNGYAMVRYNPAINADVDFIYPQEFDHFHFTGASKGDNLIGTNGSDILKGLRGSDTLRTHDGEDLLLGCDPLNGRGAGEVDELTGDGAADIFVLGDETGRFYDDGNAATPGHDGYARITDFNPAQDKLKLFGTGYLLGPSPVAGVAGSALFHDSNGNGTLEPATDELIATLGTAVITAANTLAAPEPVTPPAIESAGVTGVSMSFTGTAPAISPRISFSMNQSLRPGVTLELLASADLGSQDSWKVVASKTGDGAWTGPAATTVSAPAAGKVNAAITPVAPPGQRAFYKLQIRSL
jgi:Ca2+-binding RTX toxin-like protein